MTIKVRGEKPQYDIDREVAKISAFSVGKNDKYEYLTGEEILPFDERRGIQQAKFTYFPLRKAFGKQAKAIEDHGEQLVESNALISRIDFNIGREGVPFEKQRNI